MSRAGNGVGAGKATSLAQTSGPGLYVHVPFCLTRCGYCDFNAYAGLGHLADRYIAALRREAEMAAGEWTGASFGTVFLGGGTPTTLAPGEVVRLIEDLDRTLGLGEEAEVTVEANPDTVDEAYLRELRVGGVTRLSMGVQSFDPAVLAALERVHSPDSARRAYRAARAAGFDDVNLDLIYGAQGETLASWRGTVEEAVALGPDHLSAYALTIEPSTPLGRKVAAGLVPAPDPDLQAEMYDLACELLAAAGYRHYEVSNWALPGLECRHNVVYWRRGAYLGLGAGAHSHRDGRRWWNLRPPLAYLEAVEAGRPPVGGEERVTPEGARLEEVFLRLRTTEGIPAADVDPALAEPYLAEGLLSRRNGHLVLTERGMFLANDVALALSG
ncbi:MAG: radical SAM family heme chaperone HemW [Actinobacteria bacterium]|nr:radical SAM family heme chaperone HemW [Actinomycetota bacterium]